MNGTTARPVVMDLVSRRIKRGLVGINGDLIFNDDMHKYSAGGDIFYSPNGMNSRFVRSPIKIQTGPLCDKWNNEYRMFLMESMAKYSDMPVADKGDLCELIGQRKYRVNDYVAEVGSIPKFLQKGVYRMELWIKNEDKVISSGLVMFVVFS